MGDTDMRLRITTRTTTTPPTDPVHIPADPNADVYDSVLRRLHNQVFHLLAMFDPDDPLVRMWLTDRGLPLDHRDSLIWAELESAHHAIRRVAQ